MFEISLAEWSLHRALRAGRMTNMDFPSVAKLDYGISGIEYVNQFFKDKAQDRAYLDELKTRCEDQEVVSLLIMCDGEGRLGASDAAERAQAVDNHKKWVVAAWHLGCHSIRVNGHGDGNREQQSDQLAEGLRQLAEYAAPYELNVLVENHGGLSSDGAWLAGVMAKADHDGVGTLPDFGNFNLGEGRQYDRYQGVTELMPYAKAVSAKSSAFDMMGNETNTDYGRMLRIVFGAGYHGWVGIEFSGGGHTEPEGIVKTKALLERIRPMLGQENNAG